MGDAGQQGLTEATLPVDRCDVWCAIPVYNNAATVRDVAERTRQQLSRVLVIDDGSSDADLRETLQGLGVTVIRHERNLGKGQAILTALRHAREQGADHLIILDGDGQHYPEDIPHFLELLATETIVLGDRQTIDGTMPQSSLFGRQFSDFWIRVETGRVVHDSQSGFRAYPVKAVLDLGLRGKRYDFEVEVLSRALQSGLRVTRVPIRVWYPPASQRVSSFRPFLDNLRLSLMHTRLVARRLLPGADCLRTVPRTSDESIFTEHATPLGLAAAAATGAFIGGMPFPFLQPLLALYVAFRLHLNKPLTLLVSLVGLTPLLARTSIHLCRLMHFCQWESDIRILGYRLSSLVDWFLGSLVICPLLATVLAIVVYRLTKRVQLQRNAQAQA